ncbi:hypothetical protein C482_16058 [Natrialba chahannaoensis JCM 10990]|uniref:eCIS core domain-containing protein n=1 Tax=Natrialba chahannaoensis JCM 10990 TaxID=1227492 RepID=M0ACJ7_9EURY|nr:hypothetical protein C482_16058 [Natrialba chahannaoensis JCM 10990]
MAQNPYPELGSPVDLADLPVDSTIPRASRRPLSSRGYGPEEQQHIQRAIEGTGTRPSDIPEPVLDVLGSGSGTPLDQPIQRALEERMDTDFSNVRIHTGAKAAEAADAIDAKAFTCGNDVVFNSGEYDPESSEGQFLLAHELAHVKQQNGGATVSMMPKAGADLEIDPDPQLEREADEAAKDALADGPVTINRMGTEVHVQRYPGEAVVEKASGLFETGEEKVDEATSKTYRLSKEQLMDLVDSVETPKGVAQWIEHHDVDVASRVQDSTSSMVKGASRGWTVGTAAGAMAGPGGAVAGGLVGAPLGALLSTMFGEQVAGKVQEILRDQLGLETDQEFDLEDDTGEGDNVAGEGGHV